MQITNNQSNGGSNGVSQSADKGNVKTDEFVRLILQSLQDLGYQDAASALERDSGIALESPGVCQFRKAILDGEWNEAESLLSCLVTPDSQSHAEFLIREQKLLELVEMRKPMKALHVLRQELTPLGLHTDRLHELPSFILSLAPEDVRAKSSREQLLVRLQEYIMPSTMIPQQRWLTLLNQAFEWQRRDCMYHTDKGTASSLFVDHTCDSRVSFHKTTALKGHNDEVWSVSFSNNGRYLASTSKDDTCIIWDMQTFQIAKQLNVNEHSSVCVWSPDDKYLLICRCDSRLQLWDVQTGDLLHTFGDDTERIRGCVWLPAGDHFITGSCDRVLSLRSIDGTVLSRSPCPRIHSMQLSQHGHRLVTTSFEKTIGVYSMGGFELIEQRQIQEQGTITSLSLTRDGKYALVSIQELQEIHLWDLDEARVVRKYRGQKQAEYDIRSSFGAQSECLVMSGSEDSCVYVWNRDNPALVEVLEGHEKPVNSVSWRPGNTPMVASASDDQTIFLWTESSAKSLDLTAIPDQ